MRTRVERQVREGGDLSGGFTAAVAEAATRAASLRQQQEMRLRLSEGNEWHSEVETSECKSGACTLKWKPQWTLREKRDGNRVTHRAGVVEAVNTTTHCATDIVTLSHSAPLSRPSSLCGFYCRAPFFPRSSGFYCWGDLRVS